MRDSVGLMGCKRFGCSVSAMHYISSMVISLCLAFGLCKTYGRVAVLPDSGVKSKSRAGCGATLEGCLLRCISFMMSVVND